MTESTPRRRSSIPLVAAVLTTALVALLLFGMLKGGSGKTLDDAVKRGQRPASPGAEIARPNLISGKSDLKLASLRGKVVVLNFWASWCEPCEDEAPLLEAAHKRLGARGTVLGATYDEPPSDSLAAVRRFGLTYPSVRDVGKRLAAEYGTKNLPETFVIDARGGVVAIARGQVSRDFLFGAIDRALKSSA